MKETSLYLQVYNNIKNDIINGVYKHNTKILSKRVLAERYNVSLITIEHSLDILLQEGYLISKQKSGYYVSYTENSGFMNNTKIIKNKVENNIELKTAFPYSVYAKTVRKVLLDYPNEILGATSLKGLVELRKAISNYLMRSRGIDVDYNRIIIGSGSEYFYGLIVRTLGFDKTYAIEYPSYKQIENAYNSYKVKLEHLPLEQNGISSKSLQNSKANVLHISPFRSYPSGISATPSKKMEYIKWANSNNSYIVEDDFESEFSILSKPVDTVFSFDKSDRTIYLNTFSKTISPSVRTGYMILPNSLAKQFEENVGFYRSTVPSLDQLIIAELLNSGEFERHINKQRRILKAIKK